MADNLQIVSVIAVMRNKKGKYLLVQRSKTDEIFPLKWQNMGGKIELGETVEQALVREIQEEIGIHIDNEQTPIFLQSYSWKKDETSPVRLGLIFMVSYQPSDIGKIVLCDELTQYGWYSLDEMSHLDTIGPDSPTGTLGQIAMCERFLSTKTRKKSVK